MKNELPSRNIYITSGPAQFRIHHADEMNGGGMQYGEEYPYIIKENYPNRLFNTCYEWCAGPGYMAFNILSHGLCQNIFLTDIYDPGIEISKQSAKENNLLDKFNAYLLRDINLIPKNFRFDLVVANPPHYNRFPYDSIYTASDNRRICEDPDWRSHIEFFNTITSYLTDDAVIILVENQEASSSETFRPYIESNGLKIVNSVTAKICPDPVYFLIIEKA